MIALIMGSAFLFGGLLLFGALISLVIRDNPRQSWEQLVATVADIKGVPLQEAERRLKEFAAADMLGYHLRETYWDGNAYQEVGEWIPYEGRCK